MAPDSLVSVMTVAVCLSALMMIVMAGMVLGIWKSLRAIQEKMNAFLPRAENFLSVAQTTLAEQRAEIKDVTERVKTVLDTTQRQLTRVDDVLGDAATRAKAQLQKFELVVDDTVSRVHGTVVQLNDTVSRPAKEINAIGAGVRAAVHAFVRGQRPSPAQATSDEEMFI